VNFDCQHIGVQCWVCKILFYRVGNEVSGLKEIKKTSTFSSDIKNVECKNVSISLPCDLSRELTKTAFKNKRKGVDPKSVSAIVRQALEAVGYKTN
jgi:hypothetical protein